MEKLLIKNGLKLQELVDQDGDYWRIVYNSDLISKNVLLAYYDVEEKAQFDEEAGAELNISSKEKRPVFIQCYVIALTIQDGVSYAFLLLNLPMPTTPMLAFQILRDTAFFLQDSTLETVLSDLEDISFDVEKSDEAGHKEGCRLSFAETKWMFENFMDLTGETFCNLTSL